VDSTARAQLNEQMRRLADGDRSAFEPVYASLCAPLRAFCRRSLAEGDADDAAQHALIKLFERASTFEPDRDALTWALAIAAWEVRTVRKRRARAREVGVEAAAGVTDARPSPEGRLIDAELEAAAIDVLGTLNDSDRETLELTVTGESPEGVAGSTFRKRRERAMSRLRDAWRRVYGS
jgi:RNA polymerase sigma factor (sigma-70 family)